MANITITALPTAGAITGAELVPIVQNGVTVQTTAAAISASPSQSQPFLTIGQQPTLPNSRAIGAGTGLTIVDGGSQNALTLSVNGALLSLINSGTGLQVKTGASTVANVQIAVGTGLTISSPDGLSGNPTIGLATVLQNIVSTVGAGLISISGSTVSSTSVNGTTNQITVTNGTTAPVISIASNPVLPGTASATVPTGGTAARPSVPSVGMIRYNSDLMVFEGYVGSSWQQFSVSSGGVTTFSGGTTGLNPSTPTSGAIVLGGILAIANGGTGNATGTVATATTATNATNISGGAAGSIPYQSALNTTAFLAAGTNGYVLTLASGLPTWAASSGGVTSISGTANQITASASTGAVTLSLPATITGLTSVTSTGFTGTLTGHASLDLPLTGGTLTGGVTGPSFIASNASGLRIIGGSGSTWGATILTATATSGAIGLISGGTTSAALAGSTNANLNVMSWDQFGDLTIDGNGNGTTFGGIINCPSGLNGSASALQGGTWAYPNGIGTTTPSTGAFTTLTATTFTGAVTGHASLDLPLTGGTLTGALAGTTISATTFTGAVTGHASLDLPLSGGSMTGGLGFFSVVSITAAGTTQGTATALTGDNNTITIVASGTGVVLPAGTVGREISIVNRGANALLVYPASGAQIDSAGANLPTSVPPNAVLELECSASTQWYAITPVYVAGAGIAITQSNNGTVTFATSAIPNTSLANNSVTIGSTNIALGGTATTIAGLTSVTSTGFTGALTGNASTATTATNIAAGTANAIHYQTGSGATSFITVPTVASTYLEWNGSAFVWAAAGGGFTNPLTTTGDMIYSSSGTTPARLGIGSTGQVLTVVAGIPAWSNDVYAPAAVTITGGTINGASVGATTPSTGAFTTLSSTSDATIHGLTVGTGAGAIATNVAVGQSALAANTTATSNTAIGANALKTVTTGSSNVAIGANAMSAAGVGSNQSVAIGAGALQSGTGSGTVVIGVSAATNATGSNVTVIGYGAGGNLTSGAYNTVVGASAGAGTSGSYNSSFGNSALSQGGSAIAYNSAFGANSLTVSFAANNSAFGYNTLASNSTGANNVVVGYQAGYTATSANANTTGSNNTWVGYNTGPGTTTQLSNATALGNGALNTASNQIVLGNTSVTSAIINGAIGLSAPLDTTVATPTIASATTIAPVNSIVFISGTTPIVTITAPTTNINSAQITLIPTGIFTTTIAGNIALASTAIVSKALVMTYSVNTAKWYPSY